MPGAWKLEYLKIPNCTNVFEITVSQNRHPILSLWAPSFECRNGVVSHKFAFIVWQKLAIYYVFPAIKHSYNAQ